jgi:hypothetical protein
MAAAYMLFSDEIAGELILAVELILIDQNRQRAE